MDRYEVGVRTYGKYKRTVIVYIDVMIKMLNMT